MLGIGGNQKFISVVFYIIADGDTITILTGKTQHKIRLYGIDTPEKGQPFGKTAKRHTSKQVAEKSIVARQQLQPSQILKKPICQCL